MILWLSLALICSPQELHALIPGTTPGVYFGDGLDPLGDLDGDGSPEFLAAGWGPHTNSDYPVGAYRGADGAPVHSFVAVKQTWTGRRLAGLGDVDGDGVADYAVCDASRDRVLVRSGRDSRPLSEHHDPTSGQLGADVQAIGDVDGDGVPDLAIGVPGYMADPDDGDPNLDGRVRVVSGRTMLPLWEVIEPGEAMYGRSIASGDVDGDGTWDVVVGSPLDSHVDIRSGVDGARIRDVREASRFFLGHSVDLVDDLDGDGVPEIVAGAPRTVSATAPGLIRLYSGANGATLDTLRGDQDRDRFGFTVSRAGDADGDGFEDLLVCGQSASLRPPVRLVSGRSRNVLYHFVPPNPAFYGRGLSQAGDLDGDGLDEVLIGDPGHNVDGLSVGATWVHLGSRLYLDARFRTWTSGRSYELQIGQGPAHAPSLLVVEEIDGQPCHCVVGGPAPLDGRGFRRLTFTPGPGVAGHRFVLRAHVLGGPLTSTSPLEIEVR